MKTAISISDDLFQLADRLAKRLNISRSKLYSRAVEEYVAEHCQLEVREKLDEIYAAEPSSVAPEVLEAQAESVREDW